MPSAPVVRIDCRALRTNVEAMLLRSDGEYSVADLRHDAWGHGASPVGRALLALGVDAFLVDERSGNGLAEELRGAAVGASGGPTLDSAEAFGLPGTGGIPVMRLTGSVLVVKALRAGEGVSYGFAHRAAADTRVALVTGGYAHGIVRGLGGRAGVVIRGSRHPIVGRVAMDVCVVDIGDADVRRGDAVVFFGAGANDPSVGEWTEATGLTAAELVTAVGLRAIREYIT
ncbi:alanine racemase [Microbacterium sp. BK668]|nr:alanine racemase [Microbacterium sp. BK668]